MREHSVDRRLAVRVALARYLINIILYIIYHIYNTIIIYIYILFYYIILAATLSIATLPSTQPLPDI